MAGESSNSVTVQKKNTGIGLDLGELTPAEARLAEFELRETTERSTAALNAFRSIIEHDGTLDVPQSDQFLIKFLRPTKFYPVSAFKLLRASLEFREKHGLLLKNLSLSDERAAFMSMSTVNILAQRDNRGRRVLLVTIGKDMSSKVADHIFRMFYLLLQAVLLEPRTQVFGVVAILDFQHLQSHHLRAQRLAFVHRIVLLCKGGAALRLKEIHVLREPVFYDLIWNFSRLFVFDKIRKRTYLHGDRMESLHKFIPASSLPRDFGGYYPAISYTSADWYPVLETVQNSIQEWNECSIKKHGGMDKEN